MYLFSRLFLSLLRPPLFSGPSLATISTVPTWPLGEDVRGPILEHSAPSARPQARCAGREPSFPACSGTRRPSLPRGREKWGVQAEGACGHWRGHCGASGVAKAVQPTQVLHHQSAALSRRRTYIFWTRAPSFFAQAPWTAILVVSCNLFSPWSRREREECNFA